MRGEKTALKIAEKYRSNVEKGVESSVEELDKLLDTLSKYQNKSGSISKSKTRSKKAKQAVKETLKEINKYKTAKGRQAGNTVVNETMQSLEKNLGLTGKAGRAAAEVFVKHTKELLKVIRDSEVILSLAQAGFTSSAIEDIMSYITSQMEASVPDEMRKFIAEDDVSLFISNLENLMYSHPDLTTEDMIQVADYMQSYGFDNVDDAVERYFDDEDSWDSYDDYDY